MGSEKSRCVEVIASEQTIKHTGVYVVSRYPALTAKLSSNTRCFLLIPIPSLSSLQKFQSDLISGSNHQNFPYNFASKLDSQTHRKHTSFHSSLKIPNPLDRKKSQVPISLNPPLQIDGSDRTDKPLQSVCLDWNQSHTDSSSLSLFLH